MSCSAIGMRSWPIRSLLAVLFLTSWANFTVAQSLPTIVRVEEDWELVVGEPDCNADAPQITCVISPQGDLTSAHAVFELNGQSLTTFVPGGLQLQLWDGEAPLIERRFPNANRLVHTGEIVRWTQSVELDGGTVSFEITDGSSTTWGSFGGQGYLKGSVDTSLTDLNHYSPEVSVVNSGVSYAGNRVNSLVLKTLRVYLSTGEMYEDAVPRVVHSSQ